MNLKITLVLSVILFQICLSVEDRPLIKTRYGTYRGHVIKSRGGREILAFRGIPYAQPPVGKLRFKDPVELDEREGIFDVNEDKTCIQQKLSLERENDDNNQPKFIGVEDCLYLNVYLPKVKSTKGLLPVYFWIHGGGFSAGAGNPDWNGPELLLDGDRDMIMVAINYRLHVLGFLSANDKNLPGNLGLKDQALALKWVKDNIETFGGDPNSITIGGLSAGAASVNHHLNSKATKGLFHRAISHSGNADCSWAMKPTKEAREIASKIISFLGCPSEPEKLLSCLQDLPVESLMNSINQLKVLNLTVMYLVPVVEKDSPTAFMTKESIEEGSTVPWLTGITNEEGLLFHIFLGFDEHGFTDLSVLNQKYRELLPVVGYYTSNPDAEKMSMELKDFYFGKEEFSAGKIKNFVQFLSDRMFNHGFHKSTTSYKGPSFNYLLSYRGKYSLAYPRPAGLENSVTHADDLFYFFTGNLSVPIILDEKDLQFSNTLLDMWYNFIKTGNPTPDTHNWEESIGGKKYLEFNNDGQVMKSGLFKERMEFLDKLETLYHDEL